MTSSISSPGRSFIVEISIRRAYVSPPQESCQERGARITRVTHWANVHRCLDQPQQRVVIGAHRNTSAGLRGWANRDQRHMTAAASVRPGGVRAPAFVPGDEQDRTGSERAND